MGANDFDVFNLLKGFAANEKLNKKLLKSTSKELLIRKNLLGE